MNDELARIRERVSQLRVGLRAELQNRVAKAGTPVTGRRAQLLPGDRVFDPVTGEEGIVEYGSRETVVGPTAGR